MNASQQDKNNPHLLQSIVLIILETILTFVLKHNRLARAHAKPLIKLRTTLMFNTYLPHEVFYVTFDPKGIFFDHQLPQNVTKPDLTISASGIDLIRFFMTGHPSSLNKIRLLDHEELHEPFRLFLNSITLPEILSDWKSWFSLDEFKTQIPKHSIEPLVKRIDEQRAEIQQLKVRIREYDYDLKSLEHKHKLYSRLYLVIIFALTLCIAVILWYNH